MLRIRHSAFQHLSFAMLSIQPAIKSSLYCCLISKGRQTEREMLDGSTRRKEEKTKQETKRQNNRRNKYCSASSAQIERGRAAEQLVASQKRNVAFSTKLTIHIYYSFTMRFSLRAAFQLNRTRTLRDSFFYGGSGYFVQ